MSNTSHPRDEQSSAARAAYSRRFAAVALAVAVATFTAHAAAPAAATAVDDAYTAEFNTALLVRFPGVLTNDIANGGGNMITSLVDDVLHGTLTLNENGEFTYTPGPGFSGADSFTYRAVNGGGPSNLATVAITVGAQPIAQPPIGLYASSIVGNLVTLRFTRSTSGLAPTGYVLKGGLTPGAVDSSLPTGSTSPIFTFMAPTGTFFVRMHTISGAEESAPSNELQLFANVPAAPSTPASLVGLVNGSSLALAWRNTFGGGEPTSLVLDVAGSVVTSIPLGLTDSFSFTGVPAGTYSLAIRVTNASGSSAQSNAVTLTFPGVCSGPPEAPANFLAYKIGNTISVVWDPAMGGPASTGFVLNVAGAVVGSFPTPTRVMRGTVGPGSYDLSVRATNACGVSAATAVQTVVIP